MSSQKNGGNAVVGALMALCAGTAFGIGGAVSQIVAGHGFTTMQICVAQFLFAFIVMGTLTLVKFRPTMSKKEMLLLVAMGTISSISSFTYYIAINLTSVSAAVAIQFQYVWIAVLIQAVFERKMPGKWTIISSILIVGGSIFGSGIADEFLAGGLTMNPLGLLSAVVCAVFYASFIYFSGKIAPDHHPVTRTFFTGIGGLLLVSTIAFVQGDLATLNPLAIAPWGVLMGLLMGVIPMLCIVTSSTKIPGGLVAILTSSELPVAVLAGFVLLHEGVTPLIVIGVVVILGAIALAQLDNKEESAEPDGGESNQLKSAEASAQ